MADMPTDFWAGWIAVLTIISVLGLCWLVLVSIFHQTDTKAPVHRCGIKRFQRETAPLRCGGSG